MTGTRPLHLAILLTLLVLPSASPAAGLKPSSSTAAVRPEGSRLGGVRRAWTKLGTTPPVQILRGIGAGPKNIWRTIKQHPVKMAAAVVAIAAASAVLELLSLPAQPIMLGGCGLLTLRAMWKALPGVRDAFRRRSSERYRLLGEQVLFPAVAYGGATALTLGVGGLVESLSGSHLAAEGSKGVAYGLHLVDDLPSIAAGLGGAARRR